jgi:hypothetical protein
VPSARFETMPSAPRRQACSNTEGPSPATWSLSAMPSSRLPAVAAARACGRGTGDRAGPRHRARSGRRHRGSPYARPRRRRSSNRGKLSGSTTTASPSSVKLFALIRSTAAAIAGSLAPSHLRWLVFGTRPLAAPLAAEVTRNRLNIRNPALLLSLSATNQQGNAGGYHSDLHHDDEGASWDAVDNPFAGPRSGEANRNQQQPD